ncbi:M60 family metallopeptidase [Luteolibacter ambystomatis]|uniref:M60 family metallopeptidase n=1 Tax=Luteolibacter ambystomatis TaxID=2824561 RepID=A0A975IXL6_9BACT|nr:M60 family metallopeptidase [Luteolibacter ambystomatis]QUE49456.1 M60 family metallopeptidase [Luteolibacter ambystomatis]
MRFVSRLAFAAVTIGSLVTVHAEPSLEGGGRTQVIAGLDGFPFKGTSGRLILAGEKTFALAADKQGRIPAAGGFYHDDASKGRMIVFAHDGMPTDGKLLANAAAWVAGKERKAVVLSDDPSWTDRLQKAGFKTQVASSPTSLAGASLILVHGAKHLDAAPWQKAIADHLEHGGGVIVAATTWAQDENELSQLSKLTGSAGIYPAGGDSFEIENPMALDEPSALLSISKAAAAIADPKLSAGDRKLACRTLEGAIPLPQHPPALDKLLAELATKYGHLAPTVAKPYRMGRDPLSDLRLAAEIEEMKHLPVDKLFVHPSAAAFPGAGPAGTRVSRELSFPASSPAAEAFVNEAGHGTWRETGLYAEAGQAITVRIPAALAGKGLKVVIGLHEDELWRSENAEKELLRFPSICRTFDLDKPETKIGSPFGGLIRFLVDPGVNLGEAKVRVEGAVEAPVYVLGKTTPAEWSKERAKPGEWGYLATPRVTLYVQREALVAVNDPAPYAKHWDEVMRLADEWLGYAKWRLRPDCAVQDAQVGGGLHHSGYPLMLGPGDGDHLIVKADLVANGDWGIYHELGHGFQSCFHDQYTLATHAEVDVNLMPGIVYSYLHHRTAWDGPTHDTYDGPSRMKGMKEFLELPEAERSWESACEGVAAYDFQFGLAEAFGWQVWKDALSRLMGFLQKPASDTELASLNDGDKEQQKRDRLFVCLCAASKSNLTPWFNRYGLGKGNFPLGSKALAIAAKFPEWSGNRPISGIQGPPSIGANDTATYKAIDPDPGQIFEWDIVSGNPDQSFSIDKRSGELKTLKKPAAPATLLIRVQDCGVPRTEKTMQVTVKP